VKFVDNGVPEDFARLTFEGLKVPLCELSDEEYMWVVYGIRNYTRKRRGESYTIEIPAPEPVLPYEETSIDILDLSVRAEHCLQRAGITTIGQLCALTEYELSRLRNMGAKSIKEVIGKLAAIDCKLREAEQ